MLMLKFWGDIILNPTPRCYLYAFPPNFIFLLSNLYFLYLLQIYLMEGWYLFDVHNLENIHCVLWCILDTIYSRLSPLLRRYIPNRPIFFQQNLGFLVFLLVFWVVVGGRWEGLSVALQNSPSRPFKSKCNFPLSTSEKSTLLVQCRPHFAKC